MYNTQLLRQREDETGEGGGSQGGGSSGRIEFKDFAGVTGKPLRDDVVPPDEARRLMVIAARGHKELVKKEKTKRETIKALKEDQLSLQDYRQQMGTGGNQYKTNPKLANKVQFAGVPAEVANLPNDSKTKTNDEKKHELTYDRKKEFLPEAAPRFNPKPTPFS